MKRIQITLIILLCLVAPALADTGLKGTVIDAQTGKAVSDANILLRDQAIFVVSGRRLHHQQRRPRHGCAGDHSVGL